MAETRDQIEARVDDVRNREVTDVPDTDVRDWDAHEYDVQPTAVSAQRPMTDDPEQLEREIERTRQEMAGTLDELQERLDPERLKFEAEWRVDQAVARAKDEVEDATIGRVKEMTYRATEKADNWRSNAMRTIKDNPVPAALVGVGLGWLIMETSSRDSGDAGQLRRGRYDQYAYEDYGYGEERWESERFTSDNPARHSRPTYRTEEGYRRARRQAGEGRSDMGQRVQGATEEARQRAEHLRDEASERVSETTEEARQRVEHLRDEASQQWDELTHEAEREWDELTDEARERARRMRTRARRQTRHAKRNMQEMMRDNPMAMGAAALALGALVGWALPTSETESRLMGEYRDEFVDEARREAQSVAKRAQSAAKDAVEDVKEETKSAAKEAAGEVSEESKRATQRMSSS